MGPLDPELEDQPAATGAAEQNGKPTRSRGWPRSLCERLGLLPSPPEGHLFHGFISYSHAADGRLAPALQKGLQRFAKSWYQARALRIFRDDASMSVNANLWRSIERSLDDSEHYILLASPQAAASGWVAKEAERWRDTKPTDNLLLALTDGELVWDRHAGDFDWRRTNALPKVLEGAFTDEPRFIDLRWAREETDLSLDHARFRDAVADLAAPLHGKPKDELASEEVVQQRRAVRVRRAAAAALVALTAAALVAGIIALVERASALSDAHTAQSRLLAAEAEQNVGSDPSLSTLLALAGLRVRYTTQAEQALRDALGRLQTLAVLTGDTEAVHSAVFSADGSRILTASQDGTVRLWDARTGGQLMLIKVPGGVEDAAFSPEGSRIVTAGADGWVRIWNARNGAQLIAFNSDSGPVASAQFSPDGTRIVTAGADGSVRIWNARNGAQLIAFNSDSGPVASAQFSSDGARIVTAAGDTARIWDARSGRQLLALRVPGGVDNAAFSRDGSRVVTAGAYGGSAVWDALTGRRLAELDTTTRVYDAEFSPDGSRIVTAQSASGGDTVQVEIWDARSGTPLMSFQTPFSDVYGAAFSPDGSRIVTADQDGTARIWDARVDSPLTALSHLTEATSVAFSPSGSQIVTATQLGETVRTWETRTGALLTVTKVPDGVTDAEFSPDGSRIVAANLDYGRTVWLWDAANGRQALRITVPATVDGVAFSPDGARILTTDSDDRLRFWNAQTGNQIASIPIPGGARSAVFSPNGNEIAVAGAAGVSIWNARNYRRTAALSVPNGVDSVAFSHDGSQIVTGAYKGTIQIWAARTGRQLMTLTVPVAASSPGFTSPDVNSVQFNTAGTQLLTTSGDGTVRIWDTRTGAELMSLTLAEPGETLTAAALSPDGSRIAIAGDQGPTLIWSTQLTGPLNMLERLARDLVTRPLTAQEQRTYLAGIA